MKIPKGLKISQVRPGTGKVAEPGEFALIHYDCYLPRGEKCESSRNQGLPVQLKVGERLTYPAIAYALPGMTVGGVSKSQNRGVGIMMVDFQLPNLAFSRRTSNATRGLRPIL
jgi:hypothetical protein